jgi:DNA-binding NarL/FixJ family response regulator
LAWIPPPGDPEAFQVLILKPDRLYADSLRHSVEHALPGCHVTTVGSVPAAAEVLARRSVDLFITSLGEALAGDALDLVAKSKVRPSRARRVLLLLVRHEYWALAALRALSVDGVFDATADSQSAFLSALQAVAEGSRYWSPGVLDRLQELAATPDALYRILTDFEQLVLSVIGDGCDDAAAARQLGLCPATITAVRRGLHRKLRVQHRGELVRVAAQKGYVHFTPDGVERPGYALLAAAYHPRIRRRTNVRLAPK